VGGEVLIVQSVLSEGIVRAGERGDLGRSGVGTIVDND
jgi:hypothetical protein